MSTVHAAKDWLRQRYELRCIWRGAAGPLRLFPVTLFLLFGTGIQGSAANPISPTPSWLQLETDLTVDREVIDTRWSSVVRPPSSHPDYSLAGEQSPVAWNTLNKVPSFIEVAPTHLVASDPQVYFRPQLVLGGGSSESLRSWLRVAGFDVTNCIGPLMKMHSGFADSSTHANVSVSAR